MSCGDMQIFVQTMPTGETMSLCIGVDETLTTLKAKIQDKEGPPSNKQTIIFAGKQLEGGSVLLTKSTKIRDGDTMYLFDRRPAGNLLGGNKGGGDGGGDGGGNKGGGDGGGDGGDHGCDDDEVKAAPPLLPSSGMQIFVITMTAKTITLDVAESYTINNIKFMLAGHPDCRTPPELQRILFGSADVEVGSLVDNAIVHESTLQLSLSLDGGARATNKDMSLKKQAIMRSRVFEVASDVIFSEAIRLSRVIDATDHLDYHDILKNMSMDGLEALKTHLNSGKAHNDLRLQQVCEFVTDYKVLKKAQTTLDRSMSQLQKLVYEATVMEFAKDDGSIKIASIIGTVDVAMAVKAAQAGGSTGGSTGSDSDVLAMVM